MGHLKQDFTIPNIDDLLGHWGCNGPGENGGPHNLWDPYPLYWNLLLTLSSKLTFCSR